jgi:hypothetical protein
MSVVLKALQASNLPDAPFNTDSLTPGIGILTDALGEITAVSFFLVNNNEGHPIHWATTARINTTQGNFMRVDEEEIKDTSEPCIYCRRKHAAGIHQRHRAHFQHAW